MYFDEKARMRFINQQTKELLGSYRRTLLRLKLSENEFWVFYALLSAEEACSQQDIIREWSLSKQTVNTVVGNMVKQGLVTLETLPGTRNRKLIRITEAGSAYAAQKLFPIFEAEKRAHAKIPTEEIEACQHVFEQYLHYLQEELKDGQE